MADTCVIDASPTQAFGGLTDERLEAELCQLAANLAAGTARWLAMVAEYDRREVWASWECRSMADWLVWHLGIARVTARQYVQVARKLEGFSLLRAEFEAGRLSYSRVRAVCRVITPSSERDLVEMARYATAPQLERFAASVDRCKKRAAAPSAEAAAFESRELMLLLDDDGSWSLRARLPAEVGTALRRALDAQIARENAEVAAASATSDAAASVAAQGSAGGLGSVSQVEPRKRLVDALAVLIEAGHVGLERAAADPDEVVTVAPLVVVHRYPDGDELERGPAIAPGIAEQLACDADVIEAVHIDDVIDDDIDDDIEDDDIDVEMADDGPCGCGGGEDCPAANAPVPVPVAGKGRPKGWGMLRRREPGVHFGRKHRTPPPALRRKVQERDQCCRVPGCGRRSNLHAHHLWAWTDGGFTVTANLVMLCPFHHAAVHRRGLKVIGDANGRLVFVPNGREPIVTTDGDLDAVLDLVAGPSRVLLYGDRFDLHLAVSTHLHNEEIAAREAAGQTVFGIRNRQQTNPSVA